MYQNCCKKCGSIDLFTKEKGGNTGLYCSDCGSWIKWLGKDELRAFQVSKENNHTGDTKISNSEETIITELNKFIDYLENRIDEELCRKPLSIEDSLVKCAVAQAYEKDKNALINILNGRHWHENPM